MSTEWFKVSDDVLRIAKDVIYDHHEKLIEAKIGFLFRGEPGSSQGKTVVARAMKVDKKYTALVNKDLDFLIWIAKPSWDNFTTDQRRALIDHELCHLCYDDGDCSIVGHDIEEFSAIIERHGFWHMDLFMQRNKLVNAVQKCLFPREGGVFAPDPEAVAPAGEDLPEEQLAAMDQDQAEMEAAENEAQAEAEPETDEIPESDQDLEAAADEFADETISRLLGDDEIDITPGEF